MNLPKTPIEAERTDPKVFILYGPPKHGKTTIVSKIPGNLIIDLEDGSDYVSALKIKAKDKVEFKQVCNLIKNEGYPYKFVTIDTIDRVEEYAEEIATRDYKESLQGKNFREASVLNLPNGGGYLFLRQAFNDLFRTITSLGRNVILIGHIRDKMIDNAGKEVSSKDLDLTGKLKSIICSKADAIGYLSRSIKDPGQVTLTFETSQTVLCGSRCKHLRGQKFESSMEEFDWSKIYTELSSPNVVNLEPSILAAKAS